MNLFRISSFGFNPFTRQFSLAQGPSLPYSGVPYGNLRYQTRRREQRPLAAEVQETGPEDQPHEAEARPRHLQEKAYKAPPAHARPEARGIPRGE